MKIKTVAPVVVKPPREITMTFSFDEGWAVLAALQNYASRHPDAAKVEQWKEWAKSLDAELRRD